jgi:hypothetical protein
MQSKQKGLSRQENKKQSVTDAGGKDKMTHLDGHTGHLEDGRDL